MTLPWDQIIGCMGHAETAPEVMDLLRKIDGSVTISETPPGYGDNLNHTKYYQFHDAGIECGIRHEKLCYLALFLESNDSYKAYDGEVCGKKSVNWSFEDVIAHWGEPDITGGGTTDPLLGYVSSWIKYVFDGYALHMEFTNDKKLSHLTFLSV